MGRYSRKDMIEFAKYAKSYQSPSKVEEAYAAYLKGARLTRPDFYNSPVRLLQRANIAYLDGKLVKNRFGIAETPMPWGAKIMVISWDEKKRELNLKTTK